MLTASGRCGRWLGFLLVLVGPGLAWAQPAAPNLTLIRRNATIAAIDQQNIQAWVNGQLDTLLNSPTLDTEAPRTRAALLEHYTAQDATPAFREVLARSLATALTARYKGTTDVNGVTAPRPLAVVHALLILNAYEHPVAFDAYRAALADKSTPPAPAVKLTAVEGLLRIREKLEPPQWSALLTELQAVGSTTQDPVTLGRIYRFLRVEAPADRVAAATDAMIAILSARLDRFEQKGESPSLSDTIATDYLAPQAVSGQNAQLQNRIAQLIGRLLADAVVAYVHQNPIGARREQLERVIFLAENQLKAIATARGKTPPNITGAMQAVAANQGEQMIAELNKWIGAGNTPGVLSTAPFNLPIGLGIQRVAAPTTATAPG